MAPVKISSWQATALLATTILSTAVLFPPMLLAQEAGRDAWIAFAIGTAAGLLLALLVAGLSSLYPGMHLLQIGEAALGPFAGKLLGAAYLFFFIIFAAIVVEEFSSFISTAFMPLTPPEFLNIIISLLGFYAAYLGLEVIARVGEAVFLSIVFFLLLFLLLMMPQLDLTLLLPVLEDGLASPLRGSFIFMVWSGQIFLLGMIYPYLARPQQAFKIGAASLLVVGFFLVSGSISLQSLFGHPLVSRLLFPLLSYVRLISIAEFLERLEALLILIWVAGVYVKIAFLFYVTALSMQQVFGLGDHRPLLLPLAALVAVLSIQLFENTGQAMLFLKNPWPVFAAFFSAGGPLLLYLVTFFKTLFKMNSRQY